MLIGDRYEVGPRLGSGGMAVVHRGHDRVLDRPVALKLLSGDHAEETARARFLAEARNAARLSHPNVVTVHDTGEDADTAYIVLELVDGPTLAERLRSGPLPEAEARRVLGMALDGLAAAHDAGLVHRDVKPGNILMTGAGTAKLADFGIAKALAEAGGRLTATGQVLGTPRYLSPEQVEGREATPASDVYAMGVVLYEALAGHPPFDESTPVATAIAHRDRTPLPLEQVVPGVDPALAAVTARALAKDPAARYPDASAMRAAMTAGEEADGTGAPTAVIGAAASSSAAETSAHPAARRTARGRRSVLVAAAAVVLLLGGLALLGLRGAGGGGDAPTAQGTEDAQGDATGAAPAAGDAGPTAPVEGDRDPLPAGPSGPADAPDLPALVGMLSEAAEDAHGEKTGDLFDLLVEVLREEPDKQAKEADKASEEVQTWVREGELDQAVGARAVELLSPLGAGGG